VSASCVGIVTYGIAMPVMNELRAGQVLLVELLHDLLAAAFAHLSIAWGCGEGLQD